ncbi:hypothetical protein [Alienimonas californiensis]|uniref:Uncharacterized protein n=1 Tax=Alienimonas californiensis TaxID=2527989 RepID=A0A517PDR4_9PLAN|nr:hypothetical protein [Alienimonas californiensis]QDT17506.1 hypothetical protein CA12_36320 [Alienimonas californiensis]
MKIFRIVCSSLLVIGGLGAFYLAVRALDTQASWTAAAKAAEEAATQAEEGLPALRSRELALRNDLRAANAGFGQVLSSPNPAPDAQGNVTLDIGTQDGLTASADGSGPIVHLFAPTGNGDETVYVGPFFVQQAAERQAQLAPTFAVQPGEPQTWPVGNGDWRVRLDVPASRAARFVELDTGLVERRELLTNRQNNILTRQQQELTDAQDTLAIRERALLGDPNAPEISDAPEIRAGLIATATAEELERAEALLELDRLRRAVKNASDELRAALAENVDLAGRLPTAAPPRTASGD